MQKEKGMIEDEMVGWHHQLDGHKFEQDLGVSDGQENLACCSQWGHKESDITEQLNWTEQLCWTCNTLVTNFMKHYVQVYLILLHIVLLNIANIELFTNWWFCCTLASSKSIVFIIPTIFSHLANRYKKKLVVTRGEGGLEETEIGEVD